MKLLLLVLLAAIAHAQVPDKSTVGSTTIYVRDTTIPVPYGPDETRAVVTACMAAQVTRMDFSIEYAHENPLTFLVITDRIVKSETGEWCASVLAPAAKADLTSVGVDQTNSTVVKPVAQPAPQAHFRK